VAEWLKAAVSKTVMGGFVHRGFESPPLRFKSRRFTYFQDIFSDYPVFIVQCPDLLETAEGR
jgi:hypothetical protein